MKLSKDFELWEFTVSREAAKKGLNNTPATWHIANLKALCLNILQPLRDATGKSIVISSGYRSQTVNQLIGGSETSQHTQGQAADFRITGLSVADTIALIKKLDLPYDQLIDEYSAWVHVSYGPKQRREFLRARYKNGETVWKKKA